MSDRAKMRSFLVEVQGMTPFAAEDLIDKIIKHEDIYREFLEFIETKKYPENGVKSEGYTAKALAEKLPHLPPQNIYEFLVGLRDNHEKFKKYIDEGAPIYG